MSRRLLALPAAMLATAVLASSALAVPPERIIHELDDSFVIPASECGFEILEEVQGTVLETMFFDADGEFSGALINFVNFKWTWTNTETGATAWTVHTGAQRLTVNDDGSLSLSITGLQGRIASPDGGFIADIGRLVIYVPPDGPDELVSIVGRTDGDGGPFPELCDALAS